MSGSPTLKETRFFPSPFSCAALSLIATVLDSSIEEMSFEIVIAPQLLSPLAPLSAISLPCGATWPSEVVVKAVKSRRRSLKAFSNVCSCSDDAGLCAYSA